MRTASREAYAAALEQLDQLATGAEPARLRTTADELLAAADLLRQQPRLRRALCDPARPGSQRSALLRELLTGKVGEWAAELLQTLVSGRWSAPSELLDGCELLGVQALLASAEAGGNLADVEDELFRFGQVVAGHPVLAATLGDRSAPVAQRAELTEALLAGKASEVTRAAVRVALGGFGGRGVSAALTRLVELAAERRDRSIAYVTVATPLSDDEERRLGAVLSARYGREVAVKTTVDPRVIGGVRVQVGADLYDGTVAHRLAQARNALVVT